MKFKRIFANGVPEPASGLWSNCKVSGNLVFVSGLVAMDAEGDVIAPTDAGEQAIYIFSCIQKYIEAAGGRMGDLAKMTIFLTDIHDRPAVLEARRKFFCDDFPCSTLVAVDALIDPQLLVEIEAVAVLGAGHD